MSWRHVMARRHEGIGPRGSEMTTKLKWFLMGAALGFVSSAAVAFQESQGGAAPGNSPPDAASKAPLDLSGTGTSIEPSKGSGIEIRIPGLGKLGVLPKFDFGLELLYGVNDPKFQDAPDRLRPGSQDDDVKIRGSLKHRF